MRLESSGPGQWLVDGTSAPHLTGCVDVDLESSVFTNALPVHRLSLEVGQGADAPAVFVRAFDLVVERLDQRYPRVDDDSGQQRYAYVAPRFELHRDAPLRLLRPPRRLPGAGRAQPSDGTG